MEAYRLALADLHHTKDYGQKIDNMYVTIITLLLTADAYEVATTHFDTWAAVAATTGVAIIGLLITGRWRRGSVTLFDIVTNRYAWLRRAEAGNAILLNFVTDEYINVYLPQKPANQLPQDAKEPEPQSHSDSKVRQFYRRTQQLQTICAFVFYAAPMLLGLFTFLHLYPDVLQAIQRAIP